MSLTARHAYLVMAHNNPAQLITLLRLLDDPRNDIFLHIDQKSVSMQVYDFSDCLRFSTLTRVPSVDTNWGGPSLVQAELNLLRAAVGGGYRYYHLISGADLPLKSQNEVHEFFAANDGLEFVHFDPLDLSAREIGRVKYYYPLQELIGRYRHKKIFRRFLSALASVALMLQKVLRVNRLNPAIQIAKGAQWFSISHSLAVFVLEREPWVQKFIKMSLIPDELVLQTLVINSHFKDRLYWRKFDNDYRACMRLVEWRPRIYTYRAGDLPRLLESDFLFARKFDESVDGQVIDQVVKYIQTRCS